jgi:DNA-directed RNA polymerase specialized sigma24 family protein
MPHPAADLRALSAGYFHLWFSSSGFWYSPATIGLLMQMWHDEHSKTLVKRLRTDELTASDAANEAFHSAWGQLRDGKLISNLPAFLLCVARHYVADHYRSNKHCRTIDSVDEGELATGGDPCAQAIAREEKLLGIPSERSLQQSIIQRIINRRPNGKAAYDVFCRFSKGQTYEAIAADPQFQRAWPGLPRSAPKLRQLRNQVVQSILDAIAADQLSGDRLLAHVTKNLDDQLASVLKHWRKGRSFDAIAADILVSKAEINRLWTKILSKVAWSIREMTRGCSVPAAFLLSA